METPHRGISVLLPVYREVRMVGIVLRRALAQGSIVVVDDGSLDGSANVIQEITREESRVRLSKLEWNLGKTAAIQRALDQSNDEMVFIQDSDLEYDPTDFPQFVPAIQFVPENAVRGRCIMRKWRSAS